MKDRLIELLCKVTCEGEEWFGNCPARVGGRCRNVQRLEMCSVFVIAEFLIANGVIVAPCKVGQMVYHIRRTPERHGGSYIVEAKVVCIHIRVYAGKVYFEPVLRYKQKNGMLEEATSILGRWCFLTREEAEKVLAERSKQ